MGGMDDMDRQAMDMASDRQLDEAIDEAREAVHVEKRTVVKPLPDMQKATDIRGIKIAKVGVSNVTVPTFIKTFTGGMQPTTAKLSLAVELPAEQKGAHMSRFIELAHSELLASINMRQMEYISQKVIESMADIKVQDCWIRAEFTYMIVQTSPISKKQDMVPIQVIFELTKNSKTIEVAIPATTLCPCSKEISDDGAHNQRAEIRIRVECLDWIWLEELYSIASLSASSPCHSILKRPDEKFVTEEAYNNPRFVEDAMRECVIKLKNYQGEHKIGKFSVRVTSFESIHPHDAFAEMEVDANGRA